MSSYAIMTNTGRNKEAEALANGTTLTITEIAWGDGDRFPAGGETALLNETGRKAVQGTGLVDGALNTAFFEILLDANEGPFVIREAGLFDADGDLIAIAKYDPPVNKPIDTVTALIRLHVVFSDLENLILKVQSTDAYVPVERKIIAGTGLSGGGDLSENRTLAVAFATVAEAKAGARTDKVMSPGRVAEAIIAQTGLGGDVATVSNLNTLNKTGVYHVLGAATGSPDPNADGRLIHIQRGGEATQIVIMEASHMAFRDKDSANGEWADWKRVWHEGFAEGEVRSIIDTALPAGTIMAFAMSDPPEGWLECNGAPLNKNWYADLYAAIGTTYGGTETSASFRVPDLRGAFLRGWDNGRGVDRGRGFGSEQGHAVEMHNHYIPTQSGGTEKGTVAFSDLDQANWAYDSAPNAAPKTGYTLTTFDRGADNHTWRGGNWADETRPRNVALIFCIKY